MNNGITNDKYNPPRLDVRRCTLGGYVVLPSYVLVSHRLSRTQKARSFAVRHSVVRLIKLHHHRLCTIGITAAQLETLLLMYVFLLCRGHINIIILNVLFNLDDMMEFNYVD